MTKEEIERAVSGAVTALASVLDQQSIPAVEAALAPLWDRRQAGCIGGYVIRDLFPAGEGEFRSLVAEVAYETWLSPAEQGRSEKL